MNTLRQRLFQTANRGYLNISKKSIVMNNRIGYYVISFFYFNRIIIYFYNKFKVTQDYIKGNFSKTSRALIDLLLF